MDLQHLCSSKQYYYACMMPNQNPNVLFLGSAFQPERAGGMLSRCQHRSGHVAVCIEEDLLVWGGYQVCRYICLYDIKIVDKL